MGTYADENDVLDAIGSFLLDAGSSLGNSVIIDEFGNATIKGDFNLMALAERIIDEFIIYRA